MKINIPSQVKVGGLTYSVEIVDELGSHACADTHFQKQRIRIERADENFMQQVFLHEIIHAINGEWPEERVEFLAMSFFQFVKDNPGVFWPTKGVKKKK